MSLVEQVRDAGVVGAGGGGFPTHVKIAGRADTVIANGAECEPLLHKDAAIMQRDAVRVVRGLQLVMEAVGASTGIVGLKAKNEDAVTSIRDACARTPIRVHLLGDYYPAGDEFDLVYETTHRLIPAGGIPLQVGVVVCNVETLANVALAAEGRSVTHKTLTIAGAVGSPITITVPLGASMLDCLQAAGGPTVSEPMLCVGGVMMGETTADLSRPVTKMTAGIVVLPRDHPVVRRRLVSVEQQHAIGKSACDQCRYCTELCPRYLLGYPVEPHQVMRSLGFTATGEMSWNALAALCCACGLCTLYACPEQLFPKEACDRSKTQLRRAKVDPPIVSRPKPHGMRDGRRVPINALAQRLALGGYAHPAPWRPISIRPRLLNVPLKQSAGVAGRAIVRVGQRVGAGQPLSTIAGQALSAVVHAPVDAIVGEISDLRIVLEIA